MKKTRILLLAALASSLAFSSCGFNNLQMPKKVKVRTNATYQFNVLNFDSEAEGSKFKVSDYFDLGKILEEKTSGDSSGSGINIYKYNSGSQYQQFLIHMPIKEIEFDFSESFKNMDFSTATQSFEFNQEFTIPNVGNLNQSQSLELRNIESAINTGVVVTGATSPTDLGLTFKSTADFSFESIKYNSGKLVITAESSLDHDKISIYDGSTPVGEGTFAGTQAEINLAGVTIKRTGLTIKYTGSTYDKGYAIRVDKDSKIDTASGITIDSSLFTVPDTEVTFPVSLSENLQDVSITKGKLDIAIENPASWSDDVIEDYSITISEAITPEVTINKGDTTTDNLNGKSLQSGNIKATAHVTITLDDATIVFADPPKVQVTSDIKKFSAQVKLGEDFKTTIPPTKTSVEDLKKYINSITWENGGAGFVVKAKNTLPAGNDITLTLDAPAIGVTTSTPKPIASGTADEQELDFLCGDGVITDFTDDSFTEIVISGSIGLPTGSGSNTLKITDVTPGETYSVSLSVTPKFEWKEAYVKMPDNANFKNEDKPMNTGINKKTLFANLGTDFADKIQISSLPLYIFATMPDGILGDGDFAGKIRTYYGDEHGDPVAGSSDVYILGSESGTGSITTGKMPELIKNAAGEVTNNFGKETVNFAAALNSTADTGSLCLVYDIGLGGTANNNKRITPQMIESLQGKTSIKIDVALLMSMDFKIAGTINIDLMKLMNKQDSDLLGRTAATDISSYEAYLSVVESAAMEISNLKLPMSGDVALKMDLYKDGSGQTKEIGNGGSFALEVNPTQLMKTYPLTPDIQIILGKQGTTSNFGLLKTMPVAGKISLKVKAHGDIPVFPFSEQN